MFDSDPPPTARRHCVRAKNRHDAMRKLVAKYPVVQELYDAGPNNDGKGGWINAIKDQHEAAYRLIFYLNRLPLAAEYQELEPYEVLFGVISEHEPPNYPRVLFTTTGGVNLFPDGIPQGDFAVAVKSDSLEVVPVTFKRDLRTDALIDNGYGYVCLYDTAADALRILDLNDYHEVYTVEKRREVQVRTAEEIVVGDATFVRPFFLKYRVKTVGRKAIDARDAATKKLDDR